jgi:hypothetical protein
MRVMGVAELLHVVLAIIVLREVRMSLSARMGTSRLRQGRRVVLSVERGNTVSRMDHLALSLRRSQPVSLEMSAQAKFRNVM